MLILALCHFRAPVVNDLVVKIRLNLQNKWATIPKSKAAIPVVVWCCFSVIYIASQQRLVVLEKLFKDKAWRSA